MANGLPILCLDFDGVIHDYRDGWKGGEIYGNLTPGFYDWAKEAQKRFTLVIYSSRSKDGDGIEQMAKWLTDQIGKSVVRRGYRKADARMALTIGEVEFEFAHEKPPAFLTIDDRAMQFRGSWADFDPDVLREFRPWMDRSKATPTSSSST